MRKGFKDNNEDAYGLLDSSKLYNGCLSECPADFHIGVHLYHGNFVGGRHCSEDGYDVIAAKLFRNLNVDTTTSSTTHHELEDLSPSRSCHRART